MIKMVVLEMVEARATIKFCVKLGCEPAEMSYYITKRWG